MSQPRLGYILMENKALLSLSTRWHWPQLRSYAPVHRGGSKSLIGKSKSSLES